MTGGEVTFIFQAHMTVVWLLVALWPFSRLVHAWSIPVDYLRRSPIPYRARTGRPRRARASTRPGSSQSMSGDAAGAGRNLALATIAFALCFSAWGMLAPIAPDIQDELGLSDTETSVMISIPVVLGSLLRIPFGVLTDRLGGRLVFGVMLFYSAGAAVLVGFCPATRRCSAPASCSAPRAPPSRSAFRSSPSGSRPSARASRSASTGWATSAPRSRPSRSRRSATRPDRRSPASSSGR